MKIKIKAFVYVVNYGGCNGKTYVILTSDKMLGDFYTLVGPVEVDYELPAAHELLALEMAV